ncbi:TRAP transporter small permease [Oscillospiraceae bacterium LTW-04]|nr:TRAP transporter small permease [Oscillospiraceae bacterium MB24-C1]
MKKLLLTIEDHFCAAILLSMLVLTFVNVVARYIFLLSMPFVEELTRLGLMILSLIGAAVAAKRHAHLGLSAITDLLPAKVQNVLVFLADILGVFFGIVLTYYGYGMVKNEYINQLKTSGMQWPEWIFGMWVLVGGVFMIIRYAQLAIQKTRKKEES